MYNTKSLTHRPLFEKELPKVASGLALFTYSLGDFARWWYVEKTSLWLKTLGRLAIVANDQLSITSLFKTFLVPWHRDKSAVGYGVGIIVRLLYLPLALSALAIILIAYLLWIVLFLALPVLGILAVFTSFLF